MTIHDLLSLEPVVYFVLSVTSFVLLLRALPGKVARQFLLAIGVYVLHGAFGVAVLIYLRPVLSNTSAAGFGALAALFAWFGLGLHVLFRLTPSEKAKPRWLLASDCLTRLACSFWPAAARSPRASSDADKEG